jgi:DNA repair exonuclease SbcCD ATPase subunit
MFNWISNWFRDRAIAADFKRAETQARQDFVQRLDAELGIEALERQRSALLGQVRVEETRRFAEQQTALERHGAALQQQINANELSLSTLSRDYRAELEKLYADMTEAKDALNALYQQKQAAYDDLNEARARLDRWYSRSERTYCFGNGGRKLPTHSLFGQSLGDRACLQSDRDDAYAAIERCREEIAEAKQQRQAIYQEIQDVKQARQEMFDLKRAGRSRQCVEQELRKLNDALACSRSDLNKVKQARAAFARAECEARGLPALAARLQAAREACAQALAEHDKPSAIDARRRAHRAEWLRRHG